jgi:phage shock protein C
VIRRLRPGATSSTTLTRRQSPGVATARLRMRYTLQQEERIAVMTQKQTLHRQDRIIGGVCGGLGAFFGVNPWWFRLAFLILLAPGGLPGFLPYVILWIIMPPADKAVTSVS